MKNYLQNGHIVRVTTPAGGIASGDALIVGSIFGIAAYSSAEGDPVELSTTGVFQLPKATAAVLTVGARVALNPADAAAAGLAAGAMAKLRNSVGAATLQVVIDDRVAPGCAWIESGYGATAPLAASATVEVVGA